jgi:hypothetical protein
VFFLHLHEVLQNLKLEYFELVQTGGCTDA